MFQELYFCSCSELDVCCLGYYGMKELARVTVTELYNLTISVCYILYTL